MLFLITGTPGAGKSQYWVSLLFGPLSPKNRIIEHNGEQKPRPIYENGLTGLDRDRFNVMELEDPERWYECPTGSGIVIDEAQRIFPQRMAGREVPPKCREFETHRHHGYDIWLITQDATLLDAHVRKLVNVHIHIDRLFGLPLAKVYTYPRYTDKPADSFVKKQNAVSRKWFFYRKKYYKAYKSSEVHTVKKKVPLPIILLPLLFVYIAYAGTKFIKNLGTEEIDLTPEDSELTSLTDLVVTTEGPDLSLLPTRDRKSRLREELMFQLTPLVQGYPWTAPRYAELVEDVKSWPRPYCVVIELGSEFEDCRCLSQQGTRMDVQKAACKNMAINGFFDATLEDRTGGRGRERSHTARAAAPRTTSEFIPSVRHIDRTRISGFQKTEHHALTASGEKLLIPVSK